MKTLLLGICLFLIGNGALMAQTTNVSKNEEASPLRPAPIVKSTAVAESVINEDDPYQGRRQEFINMLTINYLPVDFPQYKKGTSIKVYNDQVVQYLMEHKDIVSDKIREKLKI